MKLKAQVNEISRDRETFLSYASNTVSNYRKGKDFENYVKIMNLRRGCNLNELLNREGFFSLLYDTLIAWNMNSRRAQLVNFEDFKKTIKDSASIINELDRYSLEQINSDQLKYVLSKVKLLFERMTIMKSSSQIVGLSKTLHFLLPNLVMPVDGKFTLTFFYGHRPYKNYRSEEFGMFEQIFNEFYSITKKTKLSKDDISKVSWNQSIPKIIDNAIIGYTRINSKLYAKPEKFKNRVTYQEMMEFDRKLNVIKNFNEEMAYSFKEIMDKMPKDFSAKLDLSPRTIEFLEKLKRGISI